MGLLNQASDGLPSVLMALVRALRARGPLPREELLALCCPPTLISHTSAFADRRFGPVTLLRWTQIGLFEEVDGTVSLHDEALSLPTTRFEEVRGLGHLLRRLVLRPENNGALHQEEGELGADFTRAVAWVLAQDTLGFPGGSYKASGSVQALESSQFTDGPPFPFQNDTRWNGFRSWAPILGFGWTETTKGAQVFVPDMTDAIRTDLPRLYHDSRELTIDEFLRRLAAALPVADGGTYRAEVERRLDERAWQKPDAHEISVSLSVALRRLDHAKALRLENRADAAKMTLLGRGHIPLQTASHVVLTGEVPRG